MLPAEAVALLRCPVCGSELEQDDRVVLCLRGHSFDIARQGYFSLLDGVASKILGDTAEMLAARDRFQQAGHFVPIVEAILVATLEDTVTGSVGIVEIGSGTGYYLSALLEAVPGAVGVALDVSKPAARRAARSHPRTVAVVADAWRGLPIRDSAVDRVLSVFAPRNAAEVHRVLAPEGRFVVVTPTPRHLGELIEPLDMVRVDQDKARRLGDTLAGHFERCTRTPVEYRMMLNHDDIEAVVGMGPSAFHTTARERAQRIAALPGTLQVTASVVVSVYRPIEAESVER